MPKYVVLKVHLNELSYKNNKNEKPRSNLGPPMVTMKGQKKSLSKVTQKGNLYE